MTRLLRESVSTTGTCQRVGSRDGKSFSDQLKAILRQESASRPSSQPLLAATIFMLRHWAAHYVVILLPLLACYCTLTASEKFGAILLWLAALAHGVFFDWALRRSLWDAGAVRPGVYSPTGEQASFIGDQLRTLHASLKPTRWAWNGDMLTLVPYILYGAPRVRFTRLFFTAPAVGDRGSGEDGKKAPSDAREVLAHDWAFPEGGHCPSTPLAIVLHGLNGGSNEPLVQDFVKAATARRWTCVVLNARGLGGTQLTSGQPFHGARTSDLEALVKLVAKVAPPTPLVGVGFSMGAIVLANYLGVAGSRCPLVAAIAVSGCMDAEANKGGYSSKSLEPFLTYELKQNFCTGALAARLANGGARTVDLAAALGPRVGCIMEFDACTVVPFYGFEDVDDYYRHMSLGRLGKQHRVAVPLLHLHACDDPIIDCDTFAPYLSAGRPPPANMHFLITRRGGHVGWCEGWAPWTTRWGFQSRAVFVFTDAVRSAPAPSPTSRPTTTQLRSQSKSKPRREERSPSRSAARRHTAR